MNDTVSHPDDNHLTVGDMHPAGHTTSSESEFVDSPPGTGTFGLFLFLAALTMFFAAGMVFYGIMRMRAEDIDIELPVVLWGSTGLIVVSSAVLHYANLSVKAGHSRAFRNGLLASLLLGFAFLVVQLPSLIMLLINQREVAQRHGVLYGLVLMLIVLHGLHVIGGLIPMTITTRNAFRNRYTPGSFSPVRRVTLYWHFLDLVWVIMFSVLMLLG